MRSVYVVVVTVTLMAGCTADEPDPAEGGADDAAASDDAESDTGELADEDAAPPDAEYDASSLEDSGIDASDDDAASADAGLDARADSDGDTPQVDATGQDLDGGGQQGDTGALPDAASDAGVFGCFAARPAGSNLLLAPGKVYPPVQPVNLTALGLSVTAQHVIGYYRAPSPTSYPTGWSVWRKSGEMTADSALLENAATTNEYFLGAGSARFLALSSTATTHSLVLREANDGSEIWRVADWPAGMAPSGSLYPTPTGGVSSDGTYVWAFWTDSGGARQFRAYDATSTTPWLSTSFAADVHAVWGDPTELVVITSDSTATTLWRYTRSGSTLPTVGPLAGSLMSAYADGTHILTYTSSGSIVRVYTRSGERQAMFTRSIRAGGGRGNLFWIAGQNRSSVEVLRVGDPPTLVGTVASNVESYMLISPLPDGVAVEGGGPQGVTRVGILEEDDVELTDLEPQTVIVTSQAGRITRATPQGIVGPDLAMPLGCGRIVAAAADASRLYISTGVATFVYDATLSTPVARLAPAVEIRTTQSSTRFALASSSTSWVVYSPDFAALRTFATNYNSKVSLSPDGTRVGIVTDGPDDLGTGNPESSHTEIRSVESGDLLHAFDYRFTIGGIYHPEGGHVRFSPSGNRFIFGEAYGDVRGTHYIYEGGTLLGTYSASYDAAWIDEDRFVTSISEGPSIMNAKGIRLGALSCPFSGANMLLPPRQWLNPTRWLDGARGTCSLDTNTYVQGTPPTADTLVPFLGRFSAGDVYHVQRSSVIEVR